MHLNTNLCLLSADERVLEEIIRTQIDRGIQRRNDTEIAIIFDRFAEGENEGKHIPAHQLRDALQALDIMLPGDASEQEFLEKLDTNKNGRLDLHEFKAAILASSTPLEEWAKGWPLAQLLADSIPRLDDADGKGKDNLTALISLKDEHLKLVASGFAYGLEKMLKEERDRLREAFKIMEEAQENKMAGKFEVQDVSEMKCGKIEHFHDGLAARIGKFQIEIMSIRRSAFLCVTRGTHQVLPISTLSRQ